MGRPLCYDKRGKCKGMKAYDLALLVLLAAMWGASFLFIRVASPALGPLPLAAARVLLAGGALALYAMAARRLRLRSLRVRWKSYVLLGAINAAIPFTLIAAAELSLTASLAAILNATTPLFAALIAATWLGERLTARRVLGLVLGLVGVAILVGWSPLRIDGAVLLAIMASLGGAVSYAGGGIYASRAFKGAPPLTLAIGQQLGAGAVLLLPAATRIPTIWPSTGVVLAFLALALLSTSVAYLVYFRLIASVGATNTLTVTILVPVFGLLWGALFLGEPVGIATVAGLVVVLASVVLVTGLRLPGKAGPMALPLQGGEPIRREEADGV